MFGRQAIRLLREAWGGVLNPDAEGVLREKGAKQLAEELYAMFDDDIPLTHNGPITINKGSNAVPLTINNNGTGPSFVVGGGGADITGDFAVDGVNVDITGDTVTIGSGSAAGGSPVDIPELPDMKFEGDLLDLDFGDITIEGEPLPEYIARHAGGGARLGIVTGGTDQEYDVDLYADGYGEDSTGSLEGVLAPAVADGEEIDAGTKLPVFLVSGTYYLFPPVWL